MRSKGIRDRFRCGLNRWAFLRTQCIRRGSWLVPNPERTRTLKDDLEGEQLMLIRETIISLLFWTVVTGGYAFALREALRVTDGLPGLAVFSVIQMLILFALFCGRSRRRFLLRWILFPVMPFVRCVDLYALRRVTRVLRDFRRRLQTILYTHVIVEARLPKDLFVDYPFEEHEPVLDPYASTPPTLH